MTQHYLQWSVHDEDLAAPVLGRIVQAVHASNNALMETSGSPVFQVSFPASEGTKAGHQIRVFANDASLLTLLAQHENIKPLRRTPGVQTSGVLPVPADASKATHFVRARDAEGTRIRRRQDAAREQNQANKERRLDPYFEIALRGSDGLKRYPLRIREMPVTEGRALNSYGLGGEGVPTF